MSEESQAGSDRQKWVRAVLSEQEGPLLRYAASLTGNMESARDAVQEVFLRLCHENPAELDGRLRAWLFKVCRSRILDVARKDGRMRMILEAESERAVALEVDPAIRMERVEETTHVVAMVAALPGNQQEVVRLRFQEGMSYKDIAEVTGQSVSNVGFLLHTAIATIRKRMKP